ncbi:histidinol-phosphatase [Archaeoglobales archaeon]|nr:MAG: histidinol-phosphatase [Archaeoglobales archaeon]
MYDLHIHSTYSDGDASIEQIIRKAKEVGLKAIAIVDHSMEHRFGLNERKAKKRQEEIDKFSSKYDIEVLSGVECGIKADGEIVLPRFKFDLVLASIHDFLYMDEYYYRIISCLKYNDFDVLAHLHSTMFGSLNGRDLEKDKEIMDLLIERDIALEINTAHSAPPLDFIELLDIKTKKIRYSVGSDSHSIRRIGDISWGLEVARKYLKNGRFILKL